jgi:cyclomaltodextrin glucanotransferase
LPALQRGVQVMLELGGDRAAFYRVYQRGGVAQTALVLLNKGDTPQTFAPGKLMQSGSWRDALEPKSIRIVVAEGTTPRLAVGPHGVAVWILDAPITLPALRTQLDDAMRGANRKTH